MCKQELEKKDDFGMMWQRICANTYDTYTDASMRKIQNNLKFGDLKCNLYSLQNLLPVITSFLKLGVVLFSPYAVLVFSVCLLYFELMFPKQMIRDYSFYYILLILLSVVSIVVLGWLYVFPVRSVTGAMGSAIYGSATKPGLYYCEKSALITEIISNCSMLKSPCALNSSLGTSNTVYASATPWLFSGDIRTLIPFLLFPAARDVKYKRRWIRTPLADGPSDDQIDEDEGGKFESVALDCCIPTESFCSARVNGSTNVALLLLSGLTGGSTEPYLLDMVSQAKKKGWSCFVMTGKIRPADSFLIFIVYFKYNCIDACDSR